MTFTKVGISRVFLAAGLLLVSSAPLMAAAPTPKGQHPVTEKSAPAAPAKATPTPAAATPGPATGPAISARKGRGHF